MRCLRGTGVRARTAPINARGGLLGRRGADAVDAAPFVAAARA